MASSAAQAGVFEADQYPVTITGNSIEGQHILKIAGGVTAKCNASYHGEETAATTKMHLTTGYSGCTFAGIAATMVFTKCHTLFTAGETTGNSVNVETSFECEAGGSIVVKSALCEMTIEPNQTFTGGLAHNGTTPGGKSEVMVTMAHTDRKSVV